VPPEIAASPKQASVGGDMEMADAEDARIGGEELSGGESEPIQPPGPVTELRTSPAQLAYADVWAGHVSAPSGYDPESHFLVVDGKVKLKAECVDEIPAGWKPRHGTVYNTAQGMAIIKAFAQRYPLMDSDGRTVFLPETGEPVISSNAMLYLCEKIPMLTVLANHHLSLHATINGLAVTFVGLPLDHLRPDLMRCGHFVQTRVCEDCPGTCVSDCRFADLQGYFDDAEKLQEARAKRYAAFQGKPNGKPAALNNPLRPVYGSGVARTNSQTLTYGQNMQILCEARENLSLHNRKTRDHEQQQFNGDVINLFAALTRTVDKLTRDVLRPDRVDKDEYSRYAVCKDLWADGHTDICHAWGAPAMIVPKPAMDAKLVEESTATRARGSKTPSKPSKGNSKTPSKVPARSAKTSAATASAKKRKRGEEVEDSDEESSDSVSPPASAGKRRRK
jgi:hypothetical protein